ncbi:MAG TPA: rhodanese-like domain-containing protein [Candidatus Angelobacter sp.]|nr:rhodanese-like domain-containing protein [Candidatus Angelobacter sp.]
MANTLKVSVTTDWLNSHLGSEHLAILDARTRGSYVRSHIRGAVHADLFHYFVPGTDRKGLQGFQKDLGRLLGNIGLTGKETVVVYESGFGMRAARVGWMLEYAGIEKVFLLEGGFQAWRKSHFPTEKKPAKPSHQAFKVRPVSTILASANQIRSARSSIVLDVRTEREFTGKEGRECDKRRGHIPRAQWLEWNAFIQDGKRFKTQSEIATVLKEKGLSKNRSEVVTYCHRGARAAAAYYALRSLGFANVRNYVGSWHEWSARKNLPVER